MRIAVRCTKRGEGGILCSTTTKGRYCGRISSNRFECMGATFKFAEEKTTGVEMQPCLLAASDFLTMQWSPQDALLVSPSVALGGSRPTGYDGVGP